MTITLRRWADVIAVAPRYQRSVHLERDAGIADRLQGYVLTPLVRGTLRRIATGLHAEGTARAWSLTGPYGSGKSAFALFLSSVLGGSMDAAGKARKQLVSIDKDLERDLFGSGTVLGRDGSLLPILVTANRGSLEHALLRAIVEVASRLWKAGKAPGFVERAEELLKRVEKGKPIETREVVAIYEALASKVASGKQIRGLLVVLDEAGKGLEYAAHNPAHADIHILQELAEAASRSGKTPIVLVVSLHQAFETYAGRLSASQRTEWAKVQGRFEDIAFQEAAEQVITLVGEAIRPDQLPPKLLDAHRDATDAVLDASRLGDDDRKRYQRLADGVSQCIHQDVDAPERRKDRINGPLDLIWLRYVGNDRNDAWSGRSRALGGDTSNVFRRQRIQCDVGVGLSEHPGNSLADAASGPGDEDDFPRNIEFDRHHHMISAIGDCGDRPPPRTKRRDR